RNTDVADCEEGVAGSGALRHEQNHWYYRYQSYHYQWFVNTDRTVCVRSGMTHEAGSTPCRARAPRPFMRTGGQPMTPAHPTLRCTHGTMRCSERGRLLGVVRMRARLSGLGSLAIAAGCGFLVYSAGLRQSKAVMAIPLFGATGLWLLAFGYPTRTDGL